MGESIGLVAVPTTPGVLGDPVDNGCLQLFLTQGRDILVDSKDLEKKDSIGRGAFATVFRASYKNGQEVRPAVPSLEIQARARPSCVVRPCRLP